MKHFTQILSAAAIIMASYYPMPCDAQTISASPLLSLSVNEPVLNAATATETKTDIITDQPAGEVKCFSRSGAAFYPIMGQVKMTVYEGVEARMIVGSDGAYYLYNPLSQASTDSYLKLEKEADGSLVAHLPQTVAAGSTEDGQTILSLNRMKYVDTSAPGEEQSGTYQIVESDNNIIFKATDDGSWIMEGGDDPETIMGLTDQLGRWYGYGEFNTKFEPFDYQPVTVPDDAGISEWSMICGDTGHNVNVAFVNKEVYVQGFFTLFPNSWVKGTVNGDKITFESTQYIGIEPSETHYTFFTGADIEQVWNDYYEESEDRYVPNDRAVFTYDEEAGTMNLNGALLLVTAGTSIVYPVEVLKNPELRVKGENISLVPANPVITEYEEYDEDYGMGAIEFDLPQTNVDGILLDVENMYYRIYLDDEPYTFTTDLYEGLDEDMTLIPYDFEDDCDFMPWGVAHTIFFYCYDFVRMGVQSIYVDEDGIEYCSDIVYTDGETSGIGIINAEDASIKATEYFDLTGRKVNAPKEGLLIIRETLTDGSIRTTKQVLR